MFSKSIFLLLSLISLGLVERELMATAKDLPVNATLKNVSATAIDSQIANQSSSNGDETTVASQSGVNDIPENEVKTNPNVVETATSSTNVASKNVSETAIDSQTENQPSSNVEMTTIASESDINNKPENELKSNSNVVETATLTKKVTKAKKVDATAIDSQTTNQPSSNSEETTDASQSNVNDRPENEVNTNPNVVETATSINDYTRTNLPVYSTSPTNVTSKNASATAIDSQTENQPSSNDKVIKDASQNNVNDGTENEVKTNPNIVENANSQKNVTEKNVSDTAIDSQTETQPSSNVEMTTIASESDVNNKPENELKTNSNVVETATLPKNVTTAKKVDATAIDSQTTNQPSSNSEETTDASQSNVNDRPENEVKTNPNVVETATSINDYTRTDLPVYSTSPTNVTSKNASATAIDSQTENQPSSNDKVIKDASQNNVNDGPENEVKTNPNIVENANSQKNVTEKNVSETAIDSQTTNQPSSNAEITTISSQSNVNNKRQNGLKTNSSVKTATSTDEYTKADLPVTSTSPTNVTSKNVDATAFVPQTTNQPSSNDEITTIASENDVNKTPENKLKTNPDFVETTTSTNGYTTTDDSQTIIKNETQKPQNGSKNQWTTSKRPIVTNVWDTKHFNYVIIDKSTNVPCTLANMSITLIVPYKTNENKVDIKKIPVPFNANATGTCNKNVSLLTIAWQETKKLNVSVSEGINELTMNIVKDGDNHYVKYLTVSLTLDNLTFPNAKEPFMKANSDKNLMMFETSDPNSVYICNDKQAIQAGDMIVDVDKIELIAFNTDANNTSSRKQELCLATIKNETRGKWIMVGAIILGIILIGLLCICLILLIFNRYCR